MHPHLWRCVISSQDEPAAARCVGRSSDCADTYLIDSGTPTLPRFPGLEDPVPLRHFVSAYRCGAVPDLHRIPFSSHSGSWSNYRHADYIVFRPTSNHYLWCFFGSCGSNAWRGLRSVWVQSAPPTPLADVRKAAHAVGGGRRDCGEPDNFAKFAFFDQYKDGKATAGLANFANKMHFEVCRPKAPPFFLLLLFR